MTSVQMTIGNRLKKIRREKKMTQKELSNGICSQAEISKVENGKNSPTIELLQQIAKKLRIPVSFFFVDVDQMKKFQRIDFEMTQLMRAQEHTKILELVQNYLEEELSQEIQILLAYYRLVNEVELQKIDFRTCISQLLQLIKGQEVIQEYFLIYVRIQMAIAVQYTNNTEYTHANTIYEEVLKLDYVTDEYKKLRFKVVYNYIRNLIKLKRFSSVIEKTNEVIKESNDLRDTSYLGHFFYQKAYALEQTEASIEKIKEAYTQAYAIFIVTENEAYKKILEEYLLESLYFTLK
ncbi:helix-turn-helix domain-containing protein [Exiguobacterium sp. s193]|uniref:helix-turn-helix domain-containing protein n=1 Tax=Exiguobacterium sp. s193 TaxID=2751207 RepID=UPI001BEA7805|nr:helix-turn-helix domain-containing protein [Exiguobacterium sp. s193]